MQDDARKAFERPVSGQALASGHTHRAGDSKGWVHQTLLRMCWEGRGALSERGVLVGEHLYRVGRSGP